MKSARGFAPILIILIVLITVLGGAGAMFAYQKYYQKAPYPTPTPSTSALENLKATPSPANETASPDPIGANWKTYRNDKYSYEFSYPSDHTIYSGIIQNEPKFIIAKNNSDKIYFSLDEKLNFCCEPTVLSFIAENAEKNTKTWMNEYLNSIQEWKQELTKIDIKETTFANKKATEAIGGSGSYGPPYRLIVIQLENNALLIIKQDFDDELFDQILSTFKFLD